MRPGDLVDMVPLYFHLPRQLHARLKRCVENMTYQYGMAVSTTDILVECLERQLNAFEANRGAGALAMADPGEDIQQLIRELESYAQPEPQPE